MHERESTRSGEVALLHDGIGGIGGRYEAVSLVPNDHRCADTYDTQASRARRLVLQDQRAAARARCRKARPAEAAMR